MKNTWFLFLCLLLSAGSKAQVKIMGTQAVVATDRDGRGMISNYKEVQGTPFVSEDWQEGTIVFSNGLKEKSSQLNFDLYSNKPLFREGNQLYNFQEPVKEISYQGIWNGQPKQLIFRNEYPAIGNLSRSFYYRVETDGARFHLLQFVEKVVNQEMVSIGTYEKKFVQQDDWYLYDVAAGKLIKLPRSKKDLAQAVSGLSPALGEYIKSKSPNPKDAESMSVMVRVLNSQ